MGQRKRSIRVIIVVFVLAVQLALIKVYLPDLATFRALLDNLAGAPRVIYVAVYAAATLLNLPLALMIASCGLIHGWSGLPLVLLGALLGASLAFVFTRHFLYIPMSGWIEKRRVLHAFASHVEKRGFRLMALVRISPLMPFGLLNYAAGVMPISGARYFAGTLCGLSIRISLGTFLAVGARELVDVGDLSQLPPEQLAVHGFVILMSLILIVTLGKMAKASLQASGVDLAEK